MFELPLSNLILLTSNDNKVITKLKIKEKQMSKKYETELDMEFDVVTRNIYVQLHGLDNHMEKFIDMDIEEYLNSSLTQDLESEWIFNRGANLLLTINSLSTIFCNNRKNEKKYKDDLNKIVWCMRVHNDKWLECEMDKDKLFINGSSKFSKLVRERMKVLKFKKRLNDKLSCSSNFHLNDKTMCVGGVQ